MAFGSRDTRAYCAPVFSESIVLASSVSETYLLSIAKTESQDSAHDTVSDCSERHSKVMYEMAA